MSTHSIIYVTMNQINMMREEIIEHALDDAFQFDCSLSLF